MKILAPIYVIIAILIFIGLILQIKQQPRTARSLAWVIVFALVLFFDLGIAVATIVSPI